ncbi:MAG TPA: hypothetical protein VHB30_02480 [Solirubrobacteraceae bacterium]|nr:hypothetical protein [Solirubrobacteraceae bacterium]
MAATVSFRRPMTVFDELSPDRRAVLQLLLDQGRGYEELAAMLRIERPAVRARALDALSRLAAAAGAPELDREQAEGVGDYLLGQQSASERAATRELLSTSPPARAWAWTVAGELLAGGVREDALPEIPADVAEVDEARDALDARRDAQRRHRGRSKIAAVLIAAAALAVAALVIVLISTGGGSGDGGPSATTATTAATTRTAPLGVLAQADMTSPGGRASATVQVVRQGGALAMLFHGTGIPRHGERSVYAIWLTGAAGPRRLGFVRDQAKADGTLDFVGALPEPLTLARYGHVLMTRETTPDPSRPGTVVLSGPLVRPAAHSAS